MVFSLPPSSFLLAAFVARARPGHLARSSTATSSLSFHGGPLQLEEVGAAGKVSVGPVGRAVGELVGVALDGVAAAAAPDGEDPRGIPPGPEAAALRLGLAAAPVQITARTIQRSGVAGRLKEASAPRSGWTS